MNKPTLVSLKTYNFTFAALMILLGITFWLAHLDFGRFNTPIGLSIAFLKALLVILYFMHIRYSRGLNRVAAAVGVFWLGILFIFSLSDYLSRNWLLLPSQWPSHSNSLVDSWDSKSTP